MDGDKRIMGFYALVVAVVAALWAGWGMWGDAPGGRGSRARSTPTAPALAGAIDSSKVRQPDAGSPQR